MHLDKQNVSISIKVNSDDYASENQHSHKDELKIGRVALEKLYEICNRERPQWFPGISIEKAYDENANQWLDMINKKICSVKTKQDEVMLTLKELSFIRNWGLSQASAYRCCCRTREQTDKMLEDSRIG